MSAENTAYVLAQIAVFNASVAGMVAENKQREFLGQAMAYVEDDFRRLLDSSGLYHNTVLETLHR